MGIAHTGEAAASMAAAQEHEVVLIDMKLPTINGLETLLAIREADPGAVAIMMTAYREEVGDLMQRALDSDAYACVYKPIDGGELLSLIEDIVNGRRRVA